MPPAAETALEWGVVQHYITDVGFGFLRSKADADEVNNIYFSAACCDVQTPPPRVGEWVLFSKNGNSRQATVTTVRRVTLNERPAVAAMAPGQEPRPSRPNRASPARKATARRDELPTQSPRETPPRTDQHVSNKSVAKLHKAIHAKRELLAEMPSHYEGGKYPRFVYVDLDNVWVSFVRAEHLVGRYPGATSTRDLLLDLEGFTRRLAAGQAGSSVSRLVAFYFNTPETIANRLRQLSHDGVAWEVRKQETTTDTTMQLELLTAKRPCLAHPKTLVLVTGDGNIAPNGMCFREILDLYLRDGWFVEVHAWLSSMARSYIEFQRQYPCNVVIRPFDDEDMGEIVCTRREFNARPNRNDKNEAKASEDEEVKQDDVSTAALVQSMLALQVAPCESTEIAERMPTRTFRAEQYAGVIRQLEGRNGELFVPSGLQMLVQSGAIETNSAIHEADPETQLLLLMATLYDEMDVATRRELQAEHAAY